jgi:hypothetical protein
MSLSIDFDNLSNDEDWAGALATIVVHLASETKASEEDTDEIQDVLDEFQEKLPTRTSLEPLLQIASDLATVVMINIVNDSIGMINERNQELSLLARRLGVQVKKINSSASLLQNIKTQIDRATSVVKTAKAVAEAAANPDLSKVDKLKAIISSLEGLSTIFDPE